MNIVFSYGEIGVDNIVQVPFLPSPERAAFPTSDTYHIGGAAANYAVLLASWGVPVGLRGNTIGLDELGTNLLNWFGPYPELDIRYLSFDSRFPTPFCRILVTPDGERSILVYGYPATPKSPLAAEMLDGVRYLALDLYGGEERVEAARLARQLGVRTIVNDLISLDHPILPYADIIVNSAAYVRSEFGEVDVLEHALALHRKFGAAVITTDGAHSVVALDETGGRTQVSPPRVQVVDATGAGDAFRAGLTYGLVQGWGWKPCLQMAVAAGSLKVSRLGAVSKPPSRNEMMAFAAAAFPDFSPD